MAIKLYLLLVTDHCLSKNLKSQNKNETLLRIYLHRTFFKELVEKHSDEINGLYEFDIY